MDFDNQLDSLILENLNSLVGDPHLFTILILKLANGNTYQIENIAGKQIDPQTKIHFKNRLNNNLLLVPDLGTKQSLLFIWDYQYPDCTTIVEIYQFHHSGFVRLFNKDMYLEEINRTSSSYHITITGRKAGFVNLLVLPYWDTVSFPHMLKAKKEDTNWLLAKRDGNRSNKS